MIKVLIIVAMLLIVGLVSTKVEPVPFDTEQQCLANNIYFEARSEGTAGQIAVGQVTLNRVNHEQFPDTVCAVVHQAVMKDGRPVRDRCQFSWYCDGAPEVIRNFKAYEKADEIAAYLLNTEMPDITDGALYYHNHTVSPGWRHKHVITIGNHIFYR